MKKCPYCSEEIQDSAIKCRYCGEWLEKKEDPSSNKVDPGQIITPPAEHVQNNSHIKSSDNTANQGEGFSPKEKNKILLGTNWKAWIAAVFIATFLNIVAAGIFGAEPRKNIIWTIFWMYLTIEAWKYWKWKALLPYPIYLLTVILFAMIMKSAGVFYMDRINLIGMATLNIGGLIIFYTLLYRTESATMSEDAKTEKIIREAELKSATKVQNIAAKEEPTVSIRTGEVKQQDDEFIELLKSSVSKNELSTIPGDDLLNIYNRTRSVASHSHVLDMELSKAINAVSEEIKKRGISKDSRPQNISTYKKPSSTEGYNESWSFKIGATVVTAAILAALIYAAVAIHNESAQSKKVETVTKETPVQELTEETWYNKASELCGGNKCTDPNKAIEYLDNAIKVAPGYSKAYQLRGLMYTKLKQNQRAIEDYTEAMRLKPDYIEAYLQRGTTYWVLNNNNQALVDLNKTIELDSKDARAYIIRGMIYKDLRNYDQALADSNKAIELGSQSAYAYLTRGIAYNGLENHNQALADSSKAIELDPQNATAYLTRGIAYNGLENHNQALADYNKAIELDPKNATAYINRGSTYILLQKNITSGCFDFKTACALGICERLELVKKQGYCN